MNERVILCLIGLLTSNSYAGVLMNSPRLMKFRHCKMPGHENCELVFGEPTNTELQQTYRDIFGLPPPSADSESHQSERTEPEKMMDNKFKLQNTPRFDREAEIQSVDVNTAGDDYRFQTSDVIETRFRTMLRSDKDTEMNHPRTAIIMINTTNTEINMKIENNTRRNVDNNITKTEDTRIGVNYNKVEINKGYSSLHVTKATFFFLCMSLGVSHRQMSHVDFM